MINDSNYYKTDLNIKLKEITSINENPIFIAHNGNSFDHKIMINNNYFNYFDH